MRPSAPDAGTGPSRELDGLAGRIDATIGAGLDRFMAERPEAADPLCRPLFESLYAYLANGGKRMHGTVCVLAHRAAGGADEAILPVAAAFQLYHHHTLVHDDIYDEDMRRRGSPTMHAAFARYYGRGPGAAAPRAPERHLFASSAHRVGAVAAFVHGKLIHAIAFDFIVRADVPAAQRLDILSALNRHDVTDNAGQFRDVVGEGRDGLDPESALSIAVEKTGRLFEISVDCVARAAGATERQCAALRRWALAAGVAYQLQDDLSDYDPGSEKGLGRGVGTDLRSAKPTFIVAEALRLADPQQRAEIRRLMADPGRRAEASDRLMALIKDVKALDACKMQVSGQVARSLSALEDESLQLAPELRAVMTEVTRYFVSDRYWRRALPPGFDPIERGHVIASTRRGP